MGPPLGWWACSHVWRRPSQRTAAAPSAAACAARINDTAAKLVECIQGPALWAHMVDFQTIANRNPDAAGHGNRDTGTSGYAASVAYVAQLMTKAGYTVTVQPYFIRGYTLVGPAVLTAAGRTHNLAADWYVARLSGSGAVSAAVHPAGDAAALAGGEAAAGCALQDFADFPAGDIALVQRGACDLDSQVANAQAAGASGVIVYNSSMAIPARKGPHTPGGAFQGVLSVEAKIPVAAVVDHDLGADLMVQYRAGRAPTAHLEVRAATKSEVLDFNIIADSPHGDPNHVVVVEGHLDSIYGAGMLDNASGSSTNLEIALKLARTPTVNHLRFIWFGGEEINLLGSAYYTKTLAPAELARIVFDIDTDVTATPNYEILVADPATATNRKNFPASVIPNSMIGTREFINYFQSVGLPARVANFGNDGTDSNSFSLVGVPNTGILTQQDCCKYESGVKIWGGYRGNFEGDIPSFNGGCVDYPDRWCDNLSNNNPRIFEAVSKGVAYVTFMMANDPALGR
jgi:Zn-dependent M28 family amino/carboxypeptidase